MIELVAAALLGAVQVPEPPAPPAPAAGAAEKTTIVEIHRIERPAPGAAPPPTPRQMVEQCDGQKFEFRATSGEGKDKRSSRILLCSDKGAGKDKVIAMLEDAARRLETNQRLPSANRDRIVADIRAKVAELKVGG